jgi:hypothetical protein
MQITHAHTHRRTAMALNAPTKHKQVLFVIGQLLVIGAIFYPLAVLCVFLLCIYTYTPGPFGRTLWAGWRKATESHILTRTYIYRVITIHLLLIVRAKYNIPALVGQKKDGCLAITADVIGTSVVPFVVMCGR